MADNTQLDPGAGGDTIATDDILGVKHQRVKVEFGSDGSATDVSTGNPLPTDTVTEPATAADGGALPAVQKVIAGYDGANTQAVHTDASGDLQVDVLSMPSTAVTGPVTDTQLRATPVPVSGTVTANAGTGPFPVSDNGGSLTVDDGAGSLTVDNPTISVVGSGTEATAQRVTIATDSTGVLSVDDNGGSLTVDGTVTANAGTGPFPVSDNAGSLTVDAPVATPVFVRLSDGAAAITALPVTDNAGSLTVDGSVALVAGAAEIGKVQISDGTDVATVLPVRTVPATTEKVLVTSELPTRLPTFQAVTAEVAPAITIGVKELLTFFHPAAVTQDVYIVEIVVSILVTTASTTGGRTNVEVFKATSVGTGGTNLAAADVGGGLGTSAVIANAAANVMQVKTGGGALGTALIRQGVEHATQPLGTQRFEIFKASSVGNGIIMRGGSADGINIQVNRVVAHTALVDQWTASIRWIEL